MVIVCMKKKFSEVSWLAREKFDLSTPAGLCGAFSDFARICQEDAMRLEDCSQGYTSPGAYIPHGPRLVLKTLAESSLSGKARGEPASADGKPHSTSGSIQGLGYLLTALRRQRLASDKLVLQLATFLRSHDLFLELSVRTPWTPRTLTANQVRHSGKQSTDGR
jgi:hypothetical protein